MNIKLLHVQIIMSSRSNDSMEGSILANESVSKVVVHTQHLRAVLSHQTRLVSKRFMWQRDAIDRFRTLPVKDHPRANGTLARWEWDSQHNSKRTQIENDDNETLTGAMQAYRALVGYWCLFFISISLVRYVPCQQKSILIKCDSRRMPVRARTLL